MAPPRDFAARGFVTNRPGNLGASRRQPESNAMRTLTGIALTRLNLLRAVRRLIRIEKGVELLRRKREALVAEFFQAARPAADARAGIADRARRAYPALLRALALHGSSGLRAMA